METSSNSYLNFKYSEDEARNIAREMFNFLNTKNKEMLDEEEVI